MRFINGENGKNDISHVMYLPNGSIILCVDDKTHKIISLTFASDKRPRLDARTKRILNVLKTSEQEIVHENSVNSIRSGLKNDYVGKKIAEIDLSRFGLTFPPYSSKDDRTKIRCRFILEKIGSKYVHECTKMTNLALGDKILNRLLGVFVKITNRSTNKIPFTVVYPKGLKEYINHRKNRSEDENNLDKIITKFKLTESGNIIAISTEDDCNFLRNCANKDDVSQTKRKPSRFFNKIALESSTSTAVVSKPNTKTQEITEKKATINTVTPAEAISTVGLFSKHKSDSSLRRRSRAVSPTNDVSEEQGAKKRKKILSRLPGENSGDVDTINHAAAAIITTTARTTDMSSP